MDPNALNAVLITRRHPIAERFQDWAFEKLFALQHGAEDAKQELAADVLGVTTKALKAFLDTSITAVPAIYLFQIGTVKDLRETLDLPADKYADGDLVFKYGLSKDLKRRTAEHEVTYGRMKGAELTLKYHAYIDALYLSDAESEIRQYFAGAEWALDHARYKELAVVPAKLVDFSVHMAFKLMGERYAGKLAELQKSLREAQSSNAQLMAHIEAQKRHIDGLEQRMEQQRREAAARLEQQRQDAADLKDIFTRQIGKEDAHKEEMRVQYEARIRVIEELNAAYKEMAAARKAA